MSAAKVNNSMSILSNILCLTLHNRVSCDRLLQLKNAFILEVERLFEGFEELEDKRETEEYLSRLGMIHLGNDNDNNCHMATAQICKIVKLLGEEDIKEARACQFMAVNYMETIVYNKCKCNPYFTYLIDKSYPVPAIVEEN
jgi:hypothetical protein